jgi:PhnB protein
MFNQAVAAGAKVSMPLMNMFWGDRYGKVTDPFGHEWGIATHIEDVPPEEMGKRAEEAMKQMAAGKPC